MYSQILSGAVYGLDIIPIEVQADVSDGFPSYTTVGFLASELKESRERVTTALRNSGYRIPAKRIVVNLSPADLRKQGTSFDLPIAAAILASLGMITEESIEDCLMVGELGLDGRIMPVKGILPIVDMAKKEGKKCCIIPEGNLGEASLVSGIEAYGAKKLKDVVLHLKGIKTLPKAEHIKLNVEKIEDSMDFSDIKGQKFLKRGMEIAAAGRHSFLMVGPPGSGKTMAADRLVTIMPDMTFDESMEVTKIYSISGMLGEREIMKVSRPVRKIHSSTTKAGMVGGGSPLRCGEASLAHKGILFLDELSDFAPGVTDALLKPMEEGKIMMSRYGRMCTFPSDFMLVAAMNPCKCGHYPSDKCSCTDTDIQKHQRKLSGPFLDRFDMSIYVERADFENADRLDAPMSKVMKERTMNAGLIQKERNAEGGIFNSSFNQRDIAKFCKISKEDELFLKEASMRLGLSARGYYKVLKVARTIADLEESENINDRHIRESLLYRGISKGFWRKNPW